MRTATAVAVGLVMGMTMAGAAASAEEGAPPMDPAMQQAMAAMQQHATPGAPHQALEPFVGTWTYTMEYRMAPDGPAQTMGGTTTNTLVFGGRFLQQDTSGTGDGQMPPFEGRGYLGYDNLRKEYVSVWFDNLSTGIMTGRGQFNAANTVLSEESEFSCPMTGETHRKSRAAWTIVDPDHLTYEMYMAAPGGGAEFRAMVLNYTRQGAAPAGLPCPPGLERC